MGLTWKHSRHVREGEKCYHPLFRIEVAVHTRSRFLNRVYNPLELDIIFYTKFSTKLGIRFQKGILWLCFLMPIWFKVNRIVSYRIVSASWGNRHPPISIYVFRVPSSTSQLLLYAYLIFPLLLFVSSFLGVIIRVGSSRGNSPPWRLFPGNVATWTRETPQYARWGNVVNWTLPLPLPPHTCLAGVVFDAAKHEFMATRNRLWRHSIRFQTLNSI